MFSRFYQGELAFLRAMGKAYAEANPTTAGLLSERGSDPDVERLLEGCAFLAARVRERIEDSIPEMVHDLSELLLPHFLRSVPAASIVEFLPVPGALRARLGVPAGTEIASVPTEGTACRFRTTADIELLPVVVQDVVLDQAIGSTPALRVQLQTSTQALPALLQPAGIRFFVQGELPLASALMLWLAQHLKEVEVRPAGSGARAIRLPPRCVRAVGFEPEFPLLPWPRFAPPGYRNVQEFFALPQKFLFFDVRGLEAAAGVAEEKFEIVFRVERPPELPARVTRETLKVNCVPVVNLFNAAADPVRFETLGEEHMLRASELPPGHMEIYTVDSAIGVPEGPGERIPYHPFTSFRHGLLGRDGRYFRLRRALSPVDHAVDTWISVGRPADEAGAYSPEVLALDVTATNRSLPAQLKIGDLTQPTPGSPTLARFRNITAVTKPVRPPLGTELHWRLLAHLAANRAPLEGPDVLRDLLSLYDFHGLADDQAGRANRLRIEGLRELHLAPARRVVGGAPIRGSRVTISLDEDHFAGLGDAWIFARALDELLAAQVAINSFSEVAVRLAPSQREYRFPARSGGKALL